MDHQAKLMTRIKRTGGMNCNKITQVALKWSRPKSHTFHLNNGVKRLMAMPVNAATRELKEHDTRLWRIFHHYVDKIKRWNNWTLLI